MAPENRAAHWEARIGRGRDTLAVMVRSRFAVQLAAATLVGSALLVSCASGQPPTGGGPAAESGESTRNGGPLAEDLFPMAARTADFVRARGDHVTLVVEVQEGGAVMRLGGPGPDRRIDVRRDGRSLLFSGAPDASTELLRLGAVAGDSWTSGAATVHFDGWERIDVPAGTFDAVRIRTVEGAPTLSIVQTWWFAPGVGLVRLRSDRGNVFSDEMSFVR